MKQIYVVVIAIILSNSVFAQIEKPSPLTKNDSIVKSSWVIGLGMNIVDDSGSSFNELLTAGDHWNVAPYPSRLSFGRYLKNGIGLELIASYNKYAKGKVIDGVVNLVERDFYAGDFRFSYDLNKIIGNTAWFDPYLGVGLGYTNANDVSRGTYNGVVGFRLWFTDNIGVDFNSSGKWAMKTEATNYIQHAAGMVYRFGINKELSKKGKEKLANTIAYEEEQQRVTDSIAKEITDKKLADELERQKELNRLAELERTRKEQDEKEQARKKGIIAEVKELGGVYFGFDSSYLNNKSKETLESLAQLMQIHSEISIEINSYTDSRGTAKYNKWLSERRANRTLEYLLKKGVSEDKVTANGWGEERLKNECSDGVKCREAQHKENRSSEFIIIKFNN